MGDYGTRIVVDKRIDPVIDILSDAMRAEGMVPLAQINVREQFARELSRDFRRYVLISTCANNSRANCRAISGDTY